MASKPVRIFWMIGTDGHREQFQGNSMADPPTDSPDYLSAEEAEKMAGMLNRSYSGPPRIKVYRCEVIEV